MKDAPLAEVLDLETDLTSYHLAVKQATREQR